MAQPDALLVRQHGNGDRAARFEVWLSHKSFRVRDDVAEELLMRGTFSLTIRSAGSWPPAKLEAREARRLARLETKIAVRSLIMAKYHEPSIGETSNWCTPKPIFDGLGLTFDLDPAHPGLGTPYCVVPARRICTVDDDGLRQPWHGLVLHEPAVWRESEHVPWLERFLDHGNGIAGAAPTRRATGFTRHVVPHAETLCFPNGKTKFVRPDGSIGKEPGPASS